MWKTVLPLLTVTLLCHSINLYDLKLVAKYQGNKSCFNRLVIPKKTIRKYKWCANIPPRCSYYIEEKAVASDTFGSDGCCKGEAALSDGRCVSRCFPGCGEGHCENSQCVCPWPYAGPKCETLCKISALLEPGRSDDQCVLPCHICDMCPNGRERKLCVCDAPGSETWITKTPNLNALSQCEHCLFLFMEQSKDKPSYCDWKCNGCPQISQCPPNSGPCRGKEDLTRTTIQEQNITLSTEKISEKTTIEPEIEPSTTALPADLPTTESSTGEENTFISTIDEETLNDIKANDTSTMGVTAVILMVLVLLVAIGLVLFHKFKGKRFFFVKKQNEQKEPSLAAPYAQSIFHTPLPEIPRINIMDEHNSEIQEQINSEQPSPIGSISLEDAKDILSFYDRPASNGCLRPTTNQEPTEKSDADLSETWKSGSCEPVYDEIPLGVIPTPVTPHPENEDSNLYVNTFCKTRF